MILGIGTDIVEIARFENLNAPSEAFAKRILTEEELLEYQASNKPLHYLAKKFAVKEAVVKATGTGIGNGVSWQHMTIKHEDSGKPYVELSGALAEWAEENSLKHMHISISDELHYACAMAIAESN
ncbi:holo-ACP synthase [Agaribacter flavus]|uniref:Holo-[acyl-carrier-protein] synthase n=1 Tax=Agaribacter flavus TaxID=1902781 RepID=A0ABV7FQG8_9ALTE